MENYIPFCCPTDMFPNEYCEGCPYLIKPCDDLLRWDESEWECSYEGTEFRDPEDWDEHCFFKEKYEKTDED